MGKRVLFQSSLLALTLLSAACHKDFNRAERAEALKDYDTALIYYERALKDDPKNTKYQMRAQRMHFEAAQMHVDRGHKLRDQGLLEAAAAEFEKAVVIDPSSFVAEQELKRTLELLRAQREAEAQALQKQLRPAPLLSVEQVPSAPPALTPPSRAPLNLKMTEDARRIYETIGKLAGINVIFDPDFQPRRIPFELSGATLEQALDVLALMTKTFWKAVTPNTIMVIPDNAAKRRAYEEQIIKTFYLSNTIQAAELNEIVQTVRTLLDVRRITPSTAQNAIIIRDTLDKVALAEKIIADIDKAKPEVVLQVAILEARRDRARELGILPSTSVPLIFSPQNPSTGVAEGTTAIPLSELDNLSSADYSIVLPSATAIALLTDATTKVIQNPEVRATDGQTAKLRIGDRVPFATGSFQPGIGGVGINPLVSTQFQFQDVGVNLDITPRVHANREVSLKLTVEVSAVAGRVNIGGIEQPIFGQRRIEHDVRLREGEVSILGGLVGRTESVSIAGWPGLAQIPFLRYFFSSEKKELMENETLIVLTPRIVRMPDITAANLRPIAVGTDETISIPRPSPEPQAPAGPATPPAAAPTTRPPQPGASQPPTASLPQGPARIGFEPSRASVAVGQLITVDVVVENAQDLFAVPFTVAFDPKVVELTDVHHGGFLGGIEQPAALVHRVDAESGTAIISLMRPPGTAGANGSGSLVTMVFLGVAPGETLLSIPQVAARSSERHLLTLEPQTGAIVVEPAEEEERQEVEPVPEATRSLNRARPSLPVEPVWRRSALAEPLRIEPAVNLMEIASLPSSSPTLLTPALTSRIEPPPPVLEEPLSSPPRQERERNLESQTPGPGRWVVQAGVFSVLENAAKLSGRLAKEFGGVEIRTVKSTRFGKLHQVWIRAESLARAREVEAGLESRGVDSLIVKLSR